MMIILVCTDAGTSSLNKVPSFLTSVIRSLSSLLPNIICAFLSPGGRIIGAIARDATEIEAREKPVHNKANDGKDHPPAPDHPPPPRKRGRPRKDEQRPKPEPTRLERQVTQNLGQMLA